MPLSHIILFHNIDDTAYIQLYINANAIHDPDCHGTGFKWYNMMGGNFSGSMGVTIAIA